MVLPDKLDRYIARHVPRTSLTGEYMTASASRAVEQALLGACAVVFGLAGVLLLDNELRGVIAGAMVAWGASIAMWSYRSFGEGQEDLRSRLRREAELDLLHARLNLLADRLGMATLDLNEEIEAVIRARMERKAHYSGLDEMRLFDDGISADEGRAFWTETAQGLH